MNLSYKDPQGNLLTAHIIAAGCFMASEGIYLLLITAQLGMFHNPCVSLLLTVTAAMALITGVVFVSNRPEAWRFEHVAFALFGFTHALLFLSGNLQPRRETMAEYKGSSVGIF